MRKKGVLGRIAAWSLLVAVGLGATGVNIAPDAMTRATQGYNEYEGDTAVLTDGLYPGNGDGAVGFVVNRQMSIAVNGAVKHNRAMAAASHRPRNRNIDSPMRSGGARWSSNACQEGIVICFSLYILTIRLRPSPQPTIKTNPNTRDRYIKTFVVMPDSPTYSLLTPVSFSFLPGNRLPFSRTVSSRITDSPFVISSSFQP